MNFQNLNVEGLAAIVSAVSAVLSVLLTAMIAIIAQSYSRRSTEIQVEHRISEHMLSANFQVYSDKEVAELYQRTRHPDEDLDYLRLLAQTRYRFGVLNMIYSAEKEHLLRNARKKFEFDSWVDLAYRTSERAFERVLTNEGFSKEFMDEIRKSHARNLAQAKR